MVATGAARMGEARRAVMRRTEMQTRRQRWKKALAQRRTEK
jgi:hypothetical protein